MSNEPSMQADTDHTRASAPDVVTTTFCASNFSASAFEAVAHVLLSNGDVFSITAPNGTCDSKPSNIPGPAYIARARTDFPSWPGPGNTLTLAFNDEVEVPAGRPHVMLHVVGQGTGEAPVKPTMLYAQVVFEGFDQFPITVNLRHRNDQGTFIASVTALDNGTYETFSAHPTAPLVAVDVQLPGFLSTMLQINVDGADMVPFKSDPPEGRRIRVILDQSVIDPPM
jgi:hypothetical protein